MHIWRVHTHLGSAHLEHAHLARAHLASAPGSAAHTTQPWCISLGDLFLLSASDGDVPQVHTPAPESSQAQPGPYHVGLLPWSAWRALLAQPGRLVVVFILTTVGVLCLG